MLEELRRVAIVTSGVAELTRNRAEQVAKNLVKAGDVRKDQTSVLVRELLRRSAENRKELTNFVRSEIKHQIEGLGLASKRDVERLERRITRLESGGKTSAVKKKSAAKKSTRKTSAGTKTKT
ncbi:MAG: phasin family protein [Actinomycetota bacterium]